MAIAQPLVLFVLRCFLEFGHPLRQQPQGAIQFHVLINGFDFASGDPPLLSVFLLDSMQTTFNHVLLDHIECVPEIRFWPDFRPTSPPSDRAISILIPARTEKLSGSDGSLNGAFSISEAKFPRRVCKGSLFTRC